MVAFNHEDEFPWFCLRTQNKHEHIAAAHLRTLPGVDVYAPRLRYRRTTRRGVAWAMEALFPGYIFAQFDPIPLLTRVRSGHGVSGIVRFGEKCATVSPFVIEDLRAQIGHDDIKIIDTPLQSGDEVTIVQGAFKNLRAVVTQVMPSKQRVKILLEFLGREMEIEMKPDELVTPVPHPLSGRVEASPVSLSLARADNERQKDCHA